MGIFKFLPNCMFFPRFLEHHECRIFQLAPYRFISMIQFWGRLWPKIPISIIWTHQIKKDRETFKPLINNGESAATGLSKKRKKVHKRNPYLWTELSLVRAGEEARRGNGLVRLLLAKATAAVLDQTLMYIVGQTCFRIILFQMMLLKLELEFAYFRALIKICRYALNSYLNY